MNKYLELVDKAQKQRIRLTNQQIKNIRDLYKDVAKDLGRRAKGANKGSLNERWLTDYQKQFKLDIKELNKILRRGIESSMLKGAEYATGIQMNFFNLLDVKYKLNSKETFSNMFSKIPQQALEELVNGQFYKDGRGLSERIWLNEIKANADFDYIIQKGLAEKKNVYDLARDLSDYVNPDVKKDWNFKNIYPSVGNKKIEYNSFRLAVTSISHAYQLSMQRSCKANPFVEGIEWHTSNSHRGPCSLCSGREGKVYKPDELPLDHPNGVCYFTPVITKSMEDIGSELHDWLYGGSNSKLDDWYKEYVENSSETIAGEKKTQNKSSDKKQFENYKKVLGKEMPKSFDKFQELKYNNVNEWISLKINYRDTKRYNKIVGEASHLNIKGIPIKNIDRIDLEEYEFDYKHINNERQHGVTKDMAQKFINNSKAAYSRWNGQ
ncbi:hypothetical protein CLLI_22460 [Clostridium liquoris]|uniref:Phage Mu protein F like protein n=1 Tax=Clostridium liquoris TaxID=1289519 RepID=A0A2T0B1L6_9CLOT|nr:hypothetical protein [Clostridium liquoris]PRR77682.1 hypothetical protein CLLI_22460 [Clostridium liquoris]